MTKSGKHCGKRRNCTFCAISSSVTMFSKSCVQSRLLQNCRMWERVKSFTEWEGIVGKEANDIFVQGLLFTLVHKNK